MDNNYLSVLYAHANVWDNHVTLGKNFSNDNLLRSLAPLCVPAEISKLKHQTITAHYITSIIEVMQWAVMVWWTGPVQIPLMQEVYTGEWQRKRKRQWRKGRMRRYECRRDTCSAWDVWVVPYFSSCKWCRKCTRTLRHCYYQYHPQSLLFDPEHTSYVVLWLGYRDNAAKAVLASDKTLSKAGFRKGTLQRNKILL